MLNDLRIGWRSLLCSPVFTLTAVGSLALGIAACTVIFSVVYALLLRPLPYPNPSELIHLGMGNPAFPGGAFGFLAPGTFKTLRHTPHSGLSAVGGFGYDYANLTGVPAPTQLTVGLVTADYFLVYGVPARLGRTFTDADCHVGSPPTVVLTDHLWRTQLNAAEDIVGQSITLDDKPRTVIGVMPASFKDLNDGCDFWQPLSEDGPEMSSTTTRRYITTARLSAAGEAGRAQLRALLGTLSAHLPQTDPTYNKGWHLEFHRLAGGILIGPAAQQALWLLLGAVGCVLLVTCANVANLQLVRGAARRREVGVRLALGASRARIVRLALTESLILAAVGGGLGALAAAWGVDAVAALLPPGYSPLQDGIRLDWAVLGFALTVATLAGVGTGLLPSWTAARQDPAGSLSAAGRGASEGPGGRRIRAVLVVAEIALALVLLVAAGLMGRSLLATVRTDAGMRLDRTLLLNLSLSPTRYADPARKADFYRQLLDAVNAVPGVSGTAMTMTAPFSWTEGFDFRLPGQDASAPEVLHQSATEDTVNPACFATLGIPLRRGRVFNDADVASAPKVIVVNDEFVRRYFPDGNVLGQRITMAPRGTLLEIVGVVGNVRSNGLGEEAPAQAYFSYLQSPGSFATLCVRAAGTVEAESLTHPVEAAVWRIDAAQPIGKVTTLEKAAAGTVAFTRLYVVLFGSFAALTLGLAVLGIYGTVAYSVGQRTREIGIRLALGAQRRDVLRLILGQGARLIAVGLAIGLLCSFGLSHLLKSLLYGVKASDPATLAAVVALLGVAAFAASYLPARRAMRIDPLTALREE